MCDLNFTILTWAVSSDFCIIYDNIWIMHDVMNNVRALNRSLLIGVLRRLVLVVSYSISYTIFCLIALIFGHRFLEIFISTRFRVCGNCDFLALTYRDNIACRDANLCKCQTADWAARRQTPSFTSCLQFKEWYSSNRRGVSTILKVTRIRRIN